MEKISRMLFVVIGALIGAGFASGKEIYIFFFQYGKQGLIGIIISCLLIGLVIYKVFRVIMDNNINNYHDFLIFLFNNNHKKIKIVNIIINSFLLILFYIMIAGTSAFLKQNYNIPTYIGGLAMSCITYISLKKDISGVTKISTILIPIIIIIISIIGVENSKTVFLGINKLDNVKNTILPMIVSSIIYASYNCICIVPILFSLKENITKKNIKYICFFIFIILALLSFFIFIILLDCKENLSEIELPVVYIVKKYGSFYEFIYGIVILTAMYTSVISTGIGFLNNLSKSKKEYDGNLLIICVTSIIICGVGFSKLIGIMYPIFGIFGMLLNCYILGKKYNKNIEKKL